MFSTLQFMSTMILGLDAKRKSEQGATAVEYGMLVALIAAIIVLTVLALGGKVDAAFQKINTNMP